MTYYSSEERAKLFKEAMDEAYNLWRKKDFDNAYRSLAKANLFIPDFDDQFDYLMAMFKMREMQASIIASEKKPDYSMYLICSLEAFALDIARDLLMFPTLHRFWDWKKNQYSPYNDDGSEDPEIDPDKDSDDNKALKKLKIFLNRHAFYKEYLDFVYNDLPVIYGIPDKYTKEHINSLFNNIKSNREAWEEMLFTVQPNLKNRSLDYLSYEIYDFVSKLIKKYYDLGQTGVMPADTNVRSTKSGIFWDPVLIARKRLQILIQLNRKFWEVAGSIYDDTVNNFIEQDEQLEHDGKNITLHEALTLLEIQLLDYIKKA